MAIEFIDGFEGIDLDDKTDRNWEKFWKSLRPKKHKGDCRLERVEIPGVHLLRCPRCKVCSCVKVDGKLYSDHCVVHGVAVKNAEGGTNG